MSAFRGQAIYQWGEELRAKSYPSRTKAHTKAVRNERFWKVIHLLVARPNETNDVLFTKCGKIVSEAISLIHLHMFRNCYIFNINTHSGSANRTIKTFQYTS